MPARSKSDASSVTSARERTGILEQTEQLVRRPP